MLTQPEYVGLRKLKIPLYEWGKDSGNFRVKVRTTKTKIGKRAARETFISTLTPKNIQAISDFYNIPVSKIKTFIKPIEKSSDYRIQQYRNHEVHEFANVSDNEMMTNIKRVMTSQKKAYKINIAVGYTLVDNSNKKPIYETYWPSSNTRIFETPLRVNGRADIPRALSEIASKISSDSKGAAIKFATSKLKIHSIDRFHIQIFSLNANLGDDHDLMPEYIKKDTNLMSPRDTRNKCLFHCIAYHKDRKLQQHRLKKPAKELVEKYCTFKGMVFEARGNTFNQYYKTFKPIELMELDEVEDCFKLCIDVYHIDGEDPVNRGVKRIRDSSKDYEDRMAIVMCMNHAIYVRNTSFLIGQYVCPKCLMIFNTAEMKRDHVKNNCEMVEIKTFPKEPTIYEPKRNVMKMICDGGATQRQTSPFQEHFIVYDFEVIQPKEEVKLDADGNMSNTRFTSEHIPCSVSVCSSRIKEPVCFINSDVKTLLKDMFMWVAEETEQIRQYYDSYYSEMFARIALVHQNDEKLITEKINSIKSGYAQVPLIGFNSGKYDINIMKKYMFGVLAQLNSEIEIETKVDSVIKKANGYMCVATKSFKMLDICNYLPAGTSYASYLKAYLGECKCEDKIRCLCGLGKGLFPYEYLSSFDVLNQTTIPPKEAFNSTLKNSSISDDDYARVQFVWNHYGMKSIKDLLIWYNNLDVVPFVDAIKVQREFYRKYDLDMFKDGVSLPGLAEKIMFHTSFKDLPIIEIKRSPEDQTKIDKWMDKNGFVKEESRGGVEYVEPGQGFTVIDKFNGRYANDVSVLNGYLASYKEKVIDRKVSGSYEGLKEKLRQLHANFPDEETIRKDFEGMMGIDKMQVNHALCKELDDELTIEEYIAHLNNKLAFQEAEINKQLTGSYESFKLKYIKEMEDEEKSIEDAEKEKIRVEVEKSEKTRLAIKAKERALAKKKLDEWSEYKKKEFAKWMKERDSNKQAEEVKSEEEEEKEECDGFGKLIDLSISEREILNHVSKQFWKQGYLCKFCYCNIDKDNFQLDEISYWDKEAWMKPIIVCSACKEERKGRSFKAFSREKFMKFHSNRLIFSIDEQQSDIYQTMKDNIVGGPSIIFKRYARATSNNKPGTEIRGIELKDTAQRLGMAIHIMHCNKIIGYDANALYLWALSQDMPCGRLERIEVYDGIIDDIQQDKIFGFLECDIHVPEHLKENFSEMAPIFKNVLIEPTEEVIGKHMFEYNESRCKDGKTHARKSRKLIGSMFGEKILLYAPMVKFLLRHGLVITKTYSFIKAARGRPFKHFADDVSNARREGDADKNKEMIGKMMKDCGNTPFGRCGMDMTKHKKVKYTTSDEEEMKLTNHFTFQDKEDLDGACEITLKKRKIKQNNPIHVAIAIYQLAKLRMLEFYYDCIDFYIPRNRWEYLEMDTDSAYIAFSLPDKAPKDAPNPFDYLIRPDKTYQTAKGKTKTFSYRKHWEANKHKWFPRTDTEENALYDMRTPGLFKQEWSGGSMISLSSKNYICTRADKVFREKGKTGIKISAKGVQKARNSAEGGCLTRKNFSKILKEKTTIKGTNMGFRLCKETQTMKTYEQYKTGLNYFYDKRQVLEDGITTVPLNL